MKIDDRVVVELKFWRRNLRDLNGWEMQVLDKVLYCREGQVKMFNDMMDKQVCGASFDGKKEA